MSLIWLFALATGLIALNSLTLPLTSVGYQNIDTLEQNGHGTLKYFEVFDSLPASSITTLVIALIVGLLLVASLVGYAIITIRDLVKDDKVNRKLVLTLGISISALSIILLIVDLVFGFTLNDINGGVSYLPHLTTDLASILFISQAITGLSIAIFAIKADENNEDSNVIDQEVIEKKDA